MGGSDFYQVLGLSKECTEAELKTAYKKLALKWHPDRCSDSKYVEEAKMKFQAIQEAYSVLSDVNKRFLYDVGVYDSDDDQDGMADFMGEMAVLMSQNKPNGNGESFDQELKDLFQELFQESENPTSFSSSTFGESSSSSSSNKRGSSSVSNECFQGFSLGVRADGRYEVRNNNNKNNRRKGRHA
ncbi:putative DnaJ domain, Chaperone J-domain superfamily [Helianthus annuus]|uniref:DnaJ domain, Chaperone J-domain superfamily n=1 Tax=Helianthus annuus TaxID=4232 RepID=A0A9K3IB05_HELAN|nr:putative DnaJ domain, Chaperone J-domain superfamily [Helianthus annuus]